MVAGIALKLLFTRLERYFMSKQARPFVLKEKASSEEKDDSIDEETLKVLKPQSKHYSSLIKGLYHTKETEL